MKAKSTNDQIISFGTYDIIDNETIVLSDFGTIKLSKFDKNSMSFSIKLNSSPNKEINISASKEESMISTLRTDLLCQAWEEVREDDDLEATVILSKAGTYFVTWPDGDFGIGEWKWKDSTETKILLEEGDYQTYEAEILELTSSTLRIYEEFGDYDIITVYRSIVNTK